MKTETFATRAEQEEKATQGVAMTMDPAAVNYITKALESLYQVPLLAALREYTSNAVDAHIAHNVKNKPVLITVDRKFLIIQDFGAGMSLSTLVEVYSRFGATTKRNTNTQVGGFGFGGKSALALTDEFFIETVHNGMLVTATVRRDSNRPGFLNPSEPTPTDLPSGTTIKIPLDKPKKSSTPGYRNRSAVVDPGDENRIKILEVIHDGFFSGYTPDQIHVNGHPLGSVTQGVRPSIHETKFYLPIYAGAEELGWVRYVTPGTALATNGDWEYGDSLPLIYIGGVRYKFPEGLKVMNLVKSTSRQAAYSRFLSSGLRLSLNVPVGSVDIPASRENVSDTPKTQKVLTVLLEEIIDLMEASGTVHLNSIKKRSDAFSWWIKAAGLFPSVGGAPYLLNGRQVQDTVLGADWNGKSFKASVDLKGTHAMKKDVIKGAKGGKGDGVTELTVLKDALLCWQDEFNKTKAVVVTYPAGKFTEEGWTSARNNVADYVLGTYNATKYVLYYIQEGIVPDEVLNDAYDVVDLQKMMDIGREVRRERRKKPTQRQKLTYVVYDPDAPKKSYYNGRVSGAVVKVDSEDIDNSYAFVNLGSKWHNNPFLSVIETIRDESKGNYSLTVTLASSLTVLGEGRKVILLPETRSETPMLRRSPNLLNITAKVQQTLEQSLLLEGHEARLAAERYAIASPTPYEGLKGVADLLAEQDSIQKLTQQNDLQHLVQNLVEVTDPMIAAFVVSYAHKNNKTDVDYLRGKLVTKLQDLRYLTIQDKLSGLKFHNQVSGPYQSVRNSERAEIVVTILNSIASLDAFKNYGE